jgi:hypothetical protein
MASPAPPSASQRSTSQRVSDRTRAGGVLFPRLDLAAYSTLHPTTFLNLRRCSGSKMGLGPTQTPVRDCDHELVERRTFRDGGRQWTDGRGVSGSRDDRAGMTKLGSGHMNTQSLLR